MKKKKHGIKWIVILLVLLAVLVALFFFGRRLPKRGDEQNASAANMNTQGAYVGSIRVTTEGNGTIEPANKQTVTADYSLRIEHTYVEDGDIVEAEDTIALIDKDSIDEQIDSLKSSLSDLNSSISSMTKSGSSTLTSSVAGRVKRIFVKEGDVLTEAVKKYGGVMELSTDGKLKVDFESETSLSIGTTVTVSFSGYEVEGRISRHEGNHYTATIEDNASYLVDAQVQVLNDDDAVIGEGVLATNAPYLVDARYGVCDSLNVSNGTSVDSGSTLLYRTDYSYNADYLEAVQKREDYQADIQTLQKLKDDPRIIAGAEGIVSDMMLEDGHNVSEGSTMYSLISTDTYWLKAEIDELDIGGVQAGQGATIVFDAFDEEVYEGKVEKVSALGTNSGGVTTYTVTISMEGAEKIKPGMSATATITLEEKDDAILIPVDAVSSINGEKYVTVVNGDQLQQIPVTLGLVNNTLAQVTEGLQEGQQVVVSSISDGNIFETMMQQRGGNPFENRQEG